MTAPEISRSALCCAGGLFGRLQMEAPRDAEAGITSDVRAVGLSGSAAVAGSIQYDIHGLARDSRAQLQATHHDVHDATTTMT